MNRRESEVDNVWFADPEPIDNAAWKPIVVYVALTFAVLCTVAIAAGSIGWAWTTFFN
jgi:hypothetical protein